MDILSAPETCFAVEDDLLNFNLDEEEEEEETHTIFNGVSASSSSSNPETTAFSHDTGSLPEFVEEELEWLSNKDLFPPVETCFGILSENPELITNHHSPKSVLENSNNSSGSTNSNTTHGSSMASCFNGLKVPTNYPVRARTKRRRRTTETIWSNQVNIGGKKRDPWAAVPAITKCSSGSGMGRRCLHCQTDKTPQWRAGPMGPKTLCNACGVRYKSGRLLPEYRPASSPTFSTVLHSNSHRKVVEMRKQKQLGGDGEGIPVKVACGYRVGG